MLILCLFVPGTCLSVVSVHSCSLSVSAICLSLISVRPWYLSVPGICLSLLSVCLWNLSISAIGLSRYLSIPAVCLLPLSVGDTLRRARASVIGMVNDREFGLSFLEVNISENSESKSSTLEAHMENIPLSVGEAYTHTHTCTNMHTKLVASLLYKTVY